MRPATEALERWKLLFSDDSIGVDLRQSVKDADGFDPCEDGLRSICWKAFLLYGPLSQASWPRKLSESRSAYASLRGHFLKYIEHPDDLQSSIDPLADDANSPWSSLRQDETSREEIYQDVERCMQDNYFFREPSTQRQMLDILFIYSKLNPDTGYRQGMHELLAPLLWVTHCDAVDITAVPSQNSGQDEGIQLMVDALDVQYVEHDAFSLFCALMQTAKAFYEVGENRDSSPIIARSRRIHEEVLLSIDPELAHHLQTIGILPQVYLIRWVRLLFGREFEFDDILKIWDLLLAENLRLSLIDMTCVVMLLRIRDRLLAADYSSALTAILRYRLPKSSSEKAAVVVRDALVLDQHRSSEAAGRLLPQTDHKLGSTRIGHLKKNSVAGSPRMQPNRQRQDSPHGSIDLTGTSPGKSPSRFLPQQKNLEALFQEVSGNIQKRAENWKIPKTVLDAVGEVKRNMSSLQSSPGQPSTTAERVTQGSGNDTTETSSMNILGLLDRVQHLENRNKALSKMLDGALESLRTCRPAMAEGTAGSEDDFNMSLAKIQFVSVYLADSEIPIPNDEGALKDENGEPGPETSNQDVVRAVPSVEAKGSFPDSVESQGKEIVTTSDEQENTQRTAEERRPLPPRTTRARIPRPSLAESSFSFMLGEGRHRSSFVSSSSAPPEQARESPQHIFPESKDKTKKSKKDTKQAETVEDGFTLASLSIDERS